jgi:hypothetical protein
MAGSIPQYSNRDPFRAGDVAIQQLQNNSALLMNMRQKAVDSMMASSVADQDYEQKVLATLMEHGPKFMDRIGTPAVSNFLGGSDLARVMPPGTLSKLVSTQSTAQDMSAVEQGRADILKAQTEGAKNLRNTGMQFINFNDLQADPMIAARVGPMATDAMVKGEADVRAARALNLSPTGSQVFAVEGVDGSLIYISAKDLGEATQQALGNPNARPGARPYQIGTSTFDKRGSGAQVQNTPNPVNGNTGKTSAPVDKEFRVPTENDGLTPNVVETIKAQGWTVMRLQDGKLRIRYFDADKNPQTLEALPDEINQQIQRQLDER